jgi:hypothetical protein
MKKHVLISAIVAVIVVGCFGIYTTTTKQKNHLSETALANIEALANDETFSDQPCYSSGTYDINKPQVVVCGSPCHLEPTALGFFPSTSFCR